MSPSSEPSRAGILNKPLEAAISGDWILGCFYLLTAVVFLSCTMVLQVTHSDIYANDAYPLNYTDLLILANTWLLHVAIFHKFAN